MKDSSVRASIAALVTAVAVVVAPAGPATGEEPASPPAVAAAAVEDADRPAPAQLAVSNRQVFTFRSQFLGASPAERVAAATQRIGVILDGAPAGDVTTETVGENEVLKIDGKLAFVVTPGDVDPLVGDTLDSTVAAAVAALGTALAEAGEVRSPAVILRAGLLALAATAVFAAFVMLLRRVRRLLERLLTQRAREGVGKLSYRGFAPLEADKLAALTRHLLRVVSAAIWLFACYLWLAFVLEQFPYTRPWGEQLGGFLVKLLLQLGAGVVASIPDLVTAVAIFLLARLLVRLVNSVFHAIEAGRIEVPEALAETAQPTRRIIVAVLWLGALIMAYPYLPGSDSEAFKGVSVLVGLMITLGGSSMVGQAVSGLVLMYGRSLRVGEFVLVGDHEGTVVSLGMLATKIMTVKNEEISIPNGVMIGSVTRNYSRLAGSRGVIVYTSVTIGYDAPWRQVHAMLIEAARRTPGLKREPPPFVWQPALSDFYVEYQVNATLERPDTRPLTLALLHANIQDVFNEHGVQILSPHYLGDPAAKVWVPKERWYAPPAEKPNAAEPAAAGAEDQSPPG
jgi:small-conductance mechanosensitive channel